jgi:hypothetical protein
LHHVGARLHERMPFGQGIHALANGQDVHVTAHAQHGPDQILPDRIAFDATD